MTDINHIQWFNQRAETFKTADGMNVEVWEFSHEDNPEILSKWAAHFRNQYCLDQQIDFLRGGKSRKDYLNDIKFPTEVGGLGPAIRAGDFGEILVADFLQWILGFWVPRVRWSSKIIRNESPKGSDVIGFHFENNNSYSSRDALAVFETKTKFSASSKNKLQEAINDSAKDHTRIAESLNFIKQKLFENRDLAAAQRVERFQSPVDKPYQQKFGAAAIISSECEQPNEISEANASAVSINTETGKILPHPHKKDLSLIVIRGDGMMALVHKLYKLAADEA